MELVVGPAGTVRAVYGEQIDLGSLGSVAIRRASHVEPDEMGRWWVDLSPVRGLAMGPFARRTDALRAEDDWLAAHLAHLAPAPDPAPTMVGNLAQVDGLARRPKGGRHTERT